MIGSRRATVIPCFLSLGFFSGRLCETLHKAAGFLRIDVVHSLMGQDFTPIFLFFGVAVMTAVGMVGASALLGPKKTTVVKQMPYESGMDPIGDARQRFDVRYYLVAIVFLLFDVELLFLYPWAVAQFSLDHRRRAARRSRAVAGIPAEFRDLVFCEILRLHRRVDGGVRVRLAERGVRMECHQRQGNSLRSRPPAPA